MRIQQPQNSFGLYVVLALIVLHAFHAEVGVILPFYREIFALIFIGLLLALITRRGQFSSSVSTPILFLLVFSFSSLLFALFDPMNSLYGDLSVDLLSDKLEDGQQSLYAIRNIWLYVPLVMYLSSIPISKKQMATIAIFGAILGPLSIQFAMIELGLRGVMDLSKIPSFGGQGLSYNSYVPYLTFPFMCAAYVFMSTKHMSLKVLSFISMSIVAIYILFSTSRQSFLFILLFLLLFGSLIVLRDRLRSAKMLLAFAFFSATCLLIFQSLEVQYSEKFLDRFSGLDGFLNSPSRWAKMEEGLTLLSPYELVSGAGLTSVMFSGPHNDYIRWIQRVGVVMALLAFAPYAYLFFQNILRGFSEKRFLSEFSFLAGLCLFTLYHSFFGYPRDDAFQALVCFLALGVSVGFARWVRASRTNGSASEKHI